MIKTLITSAFFLSITASAMAQSAPADAQPTPPAEAAAPASPLFSSSSTRGPIEISSEQLEVRQPEQIAIFTGNVLAVQDTMNLKADKMTVYYRSGDEKQANMESVSRIDVDGNVFITNPEETASGSKGIYDVDKNEIRLLGDVVLTRGKNILKGNALIYDMTSGKSVLTHADGTSTPSRVRALFVPEEKTEGKP